MDQGELAECTLFYTSQKSGTGSFFAVDSPTRLYRQPDSLFHGMCETSNITAEDIELAQAN